MSDTLRAVVQSVVRGQHGPFAVATSRQVEGSVTFSLAHPVWQERGEPEPGVTVVLSNLVKKRAGWRAMEARFLRPSDITQPAKEH